MALQLEGRIATGNDLLDSDLRDIHIVRGINGGTYLYAATGQNGGISVYDLNGSGLASLSDTSYFSTSGISMGGFDVVTLDGVKQLILSGTGNGALVTYGFAADGDLGSPGQNDLPGSGAETAGALAAHALSSGKTALYMVDADGGALGAYVSDGAGGIVGKAGLGGKADAYAFSGVAGLETVMMGGKPWLLGADTASGSVRSYRIDDATGGLTYADSLGAADGLGVAAPSAMQIVKAYGATWVILAASGSGSLSVMKLKGDGQLDPADHILDTLATRFGGVAALEVIKVQGHVLVLAGGADDGLALFSLLPGGQLVHMQSLAQTQGAGLENVTGIEAVEVAGEIRIFVTSGAASGISQFSLSLDDLGAVIQASGSSGGGSGGGEVLGTGAGDLIIGAGPQDRLMGKAGDDILVASQGGAVLNGGAGADIFVLCPTSGTLEVSDFKPGVDRIDMSHFPNLRSLAQLDFTATASGIEIGYGTTLIRVRSFDGASLTPSDLWPAGFDTPDRVPIPPGPVIRIITGSDGADILNGAAGQDTIRGLAGDDRIHGAGGNDRVFGGKGDDLLKGNKGNDLLKGRADDDTLKGGRGADKLYGGKGNDTGYGGAGDDLLKGGGGRDMLKGGRGADTLYGGKGKDTLNGGPGADILTGGGAADVFVFTGGQGGGQGKDRIADFTPGADQIRIDIAGVGFNDLTLTRQGADTAINFGAGTITLSDVLPKDLSASDFLFS